MRIRVVLQVERPVSLPVNHQHLLAAVIERFLARSVERFAPQAGGEVQPDAAPFPLYAFSPVRSSRRKVEDGSLTISQGSAEWFVSSPVPAFLTALANDLGQEHALEVGSRVLHVSRVETLPEPEAATRARYTCLSPLVVSQTDASGRIRYLGAADPDFAEAVLHDLARKYAAVHGGEPPAGVVDLTFDAAYVASHRSLRTVEYRGEKVKGVLAPFTASGPAELLQVGYVCGFGERNLQGFGMVVADWREESSSRAPRRRKR